MRRTQEIAAPLLTFDSTISPKMNRESDSPENPCVSLRAVGADIICSLSADGIAVLKAHPSRQKGGYIIVETTCVLCVV